MISVHCFRFHRAFSVLCCLLFHIKVQFHEKCFICGSCCCCCFVVWRCRLTFFFRPFIGIGATVCRSVWYKRPACKSNRSCCFVYKRKCVYSVLFWLHSIHNWLKWKLPVYCLPSTHTFIHLFESSCICVIHSHFREFANKTKSRSPSFLFQQKIKRRWHSRSNNFNSILFANLWW